MIALAAIVEIVRRDWLRAFRQKGRLLGGLLRPFMWFALVGTGYNAVAHVQGAPSYRAFVLPGVIVMAAMFGAMLTAIGTVYDREFGMLRLMLASPAGSAAVLAGRTAAATLVGSLQAVVVLVFVPLVLHSEPRDMVLALLVVIVCAAVSGVLGLLIAAPIRSVENFAGVINVVLFPLLFSSGALYPTAGMPAVLRWLARAKPISYCVDLMRAALRLPTEFAVWQSAAVLIGTLIGGFVMTLLLFDPERRFTTRVART